MQDKTPSSSTSTSTQTLSVQSMVNPLTHLNDGKSVLLLRIDPDTRKEFYTEIKSTYPLYPLANLLDQAQHTLKQPEFSLRTNDNMKSIMTELVNQAYVDSSKAIVELEKRWVVKNKAEVECFNVSLHLISRIIQTYFLESPQHLIQICEIFLKLLKLCHKHMDVKKMKADMNGFYENHISGAMEMLTIGFMCLGNWQLSETYAHKCLTLYGTFKNRDSGNMAKRYCDAKTVLARVYLEYGHLENAIKMLEEAAFFLKKPNIDNFSDLGRGIADQSLKIADQCHKSVDYVGALKVYQIFKSTEQACQKKMNSLTSEEKKNIFEFKEKLEVIFKDAKAQYFELLGATINGHSSTKALLEKIQPSILGRHLTITLKETGQLPYLKSVLEKLKINVEKMASDQLKVDLYQCTPEILKNACENVVELMKKADEESAKRKEMERKIADAASAPISTASSTTTTFFSSYESEKKSPGEDSPPKEKKEKREKPGKDFWRESNAESTTEKSGEVKTYHWSNADVTYRSSEENEGEVKMLSGDGTPKDLYFAYIPEALKDHALYSQWENKLALGKTGYDSVRYISKELKRMQQNFSSEYPYKFKIVISNHDERLYGWVDDCVVDAKGKRHYLICFGHVDDHKVKYLPNPEMLKKGFAKEDGKKDPDVDENEKSSRASTPSV